MRSPRYFSASNKRMVGFLCLALFSIFFILFSGGGEADTDALCRREVKLRLRASGRLRALAQRVRSPEDTESQTTLEMELLEVLYELDPRIRASEEAWDETARAPVQPCDYDGVNDVLFDCSPVAELVTVLSVTPGRCPGEARRSDVYISLPKSIPVLIGRKAPPLRCSLSQSPPRSAGRLLNMLARGAWTPLALVARDALRVDSTARLARLVRANGGGGAAGGAVRDRRGRWSAGCVQTSLRRYALRVVRGHRHAQHGCMRCDELRGPFVVPVKLLREVPFSDSLPDTVVFTDWFLRLKMRNVTVLACPDSLFYVKDAAEDDEEEVEKAASKGEEEERRAAWRSLATIWNVDRVVFSGRPPMRFTCQEVSVDCRRWSRPLNGLQIPHCCLQEVAQALQALDKFAGQRQLRYSISHDAVLGAVKLASVLPWHPHGVLRVEHGWENTDWMDLRLQTSANDSQNGERVFDVLSRVFDVTPSRMEPRSGVAPPPTRVRLMGVWVCAPFNPGAYARALYGKNYLKHAMNRHRDQLTANSSDHQLDVDVNVNCRHRECANNYHRSGSLDYSVENLLSR